MSAVPVRGDSDVDSTEYFIRHEPCAFVNSRSVSPCAAVTDGTDIVSRDQMPASRGQIAQEYFLVGECQDDVAEHAAPDYAVVVDTFMSGDTPDVDYHREMPTGIGRGPVMLLANSGSIMHGSMKRIMHAAAQKAPARPDENAASWKPSFTL